jgi:hypothetical protein
MHITFLFRTAAINYQLLLSKLRHCVLTECNFNIGLIFLYTISYVNTSYEIHTLEQVVMNDVYMKNGCVRLLL